MTNPDHDTGLPPPGFGGVRPNDPASAAGRAGNRAGAPGDVGATAPAEGFRPVDEDATTLFAFNAASSIGSRLGKEPAVDLRDREVAAPESDIAPKYRTTKLLGRGGMGQVALGVDRDLRREVAIKTILGSSDDIQLTRFIEEAQVTGQLEHPGIVPVHELGVDGAERPFIVMKRVRGRTLADVLDAVRDGLSTGLGADARLSAYASTHVPLHQAETVKQATADAADADPTQHAPAAQRRSTGARASHRSSRVSGRSRASRISDRHTGASGRRASISGRLGDASAVAETPEKALARLLDVFGKVCDAIAYAHSRGVIHRDIKPENIMVGEFGEVHAMDWGLAKIVGRPETHAGRLVITDRSESPDGVARTLDGVVAGTPMYMPPEQARGEVEKLDERGDVYSLGAVLYELLSLAKPFDGNNAYEVLSRVTGGMSQAPSKRSKAPWMIPRELEAVVLKAMARDPAKRYQSVLELRLDIEAWEAGRTLVAAEYSPWQLLAKWARRNRTVVAGAAVGLIAIVAGIIGVSVVGAEAEARTEAEAIARDVSAAEAAWEAAEVERAAAERIRFDISSPQDYFRPNLLALLALGKALQMHPEPPGEWNETVRDYSVRLKAVALRANDWSMASVLAKAPESWGAVDVEVADASLAEVQAEYESRVAADRQRFLDVLNEIATREARDNEQGARQRDKLYVRYITPNSIPAFSAQLAQLPSRSMVAEECIERLERDNRLRETGSATPSAVEPLTAAQRMLLVELLGRLRLVGLGDEELAVPALIADTLARSSELRVPSVERAAWLRSLSRIEAVAPGCFDELGRPAAELLRDAVDASPDHPDVVRAHESIQDFWSVLDGDGLPRVDDSEAGRLRLNRVLDDLGEWCAASTRSGAAYTELLHELYLAREQWTAPDGSVWPLSERQQVFIIDQIGFNGDRLALQGDDASRDVGQALFEELMAATIDDVADEKALAPRGSEERTRFERIVAVSNSLARMRIKEALPALYNLRPGLGNRSIFVARTNGAIKLLPTDFLLEAATESPRNQFAAGTALFQRREYEHAIQLWRLAAVAEPARMTLALTLCGVASHYLGRTDDAIRYYTRALDTEVTPTAYANRGLVHLAKGETELASADVEAALALDPDLIIALVNRAKLAEQVDDLDAALGDLQRAVAIDPTYSVAQSDLGNLLARMGRHDEAIAAFAEATKYSPETPAFLVNLGTAMYRAGEYDRAIEAYTSAIEFAPINPELHVNRGLAFEAAGNRDAAMRSYNEAVWIDPDHTYARASRGTLLSRLERYAEAVPDYEHAVAIDPGFWEAWANLGIALAMTDRRDEAERAFERALELSPPEQRDSIDFNRRVALDLPRREADPEGLPRVEEAFLQPGRYRGYLGDGDRQVDRSGEFFDLFDVRLKAGQILRVHMHSDEVDSYLSLFTIEGDNIGTSDDTNQLRDASFEFTAPTDIDLRVVCTTARPGDTGNYVVVIEILDAPDDDGDDSDE